MNKAKYLKPCAHIVHTETESFICNSDKTVTGNAGNTTTNPDGTDPAEGGGAGTGDVANETDF